MPKQTFYNIPLEKQKLIIDIAIQEFTSKSFEEVNVKTIASKAKISRGSFYTYFEDLDELFNHIMRHVRESRIKYAKGLIKETDGDYFQFIKKLFAYDFDVFNTEKKYSLFRNYIRYIQLFKRKSLKTVFFNQLIDSFSGSEKHQFNEIFNLDDYNIMNDKDFIDLIEMTFLIMVNTYFKSETENLNKEQIISLFEKRISVIEYGVKKTDWRHNS